MDKIPWYFKGLIVVFIVVTFLWIMISDGLPIALEIFIVVGVAVWVIIVVLRHIKSRNDTVSQRGQGSPSGRRIFKKVQGSDFPNYRDRVMARFTDFAGQEEAKQELMDVVDFLKNFKNFERVGARIPRGVLLIGPPGTGKILLARVVAGEADEIARILDLP